MRVCRKCWDKVGSIFNEMRGICLFSLRESKEAGSALAAEEGPLAEMLTIAPLFRLLDLHVVFDGKGTSTPLSLRTSITRPDPRDTHGYWDNSIQRGLEHSLASPWPGHITVMGRRAFGWWPVDDSCVRSNVPR